MRAFPWWSSVIFAAISYNGLKYGIPHFWEVTPSTSEFLGLLAPLTAIAFLLLAGKQLYDKAPPRETDDEGES